MTGLGIRRLTVGYGSTPVLSGVTIPRIQPGSIVGVLGSNGAGKSTFLRSLAGLLDHHGEVELDATDLRSLSHAARSRLIGYLPQSLPQMSTLVAYEAVLSACRAIQSDLPTAVIETAVEDIFDRLDIRDLAFQALSKFSGGQRQMVGLAQILVRKPNILLLDEPTSALDLRWQMDVFRIVRDIIAETGGICLIALHDINLAMRNCDALVVLGGGGILTTGEPGAAITARTLRDAYGVRGRIETCTQGRPFVIIDADPSPLAHYG